MADPGFVFGGGVGGGGGGGGGKGAGGKYKKTCLSLQTNLFAISEDTSGK